jgi:hypothetical protein
VAPSVRDIQRIVAIESPILRNLEITYCYSRLAAACGERKGTRFEPAPAARDDCGARDWSNLHQRMHYIVYLFHVFRLSEQLTEPPFSAGQVATFSRGVIPEGEL